MGLIHECTQEVQSYARESFLFWLAEWNTAWQTQEYWRMVNLKNDLKLAGMKVFRAIESQPGGMFYTEDA